MQGLLPRPQTLKEPWAWSWKQGLAGPATSPLSACFPSAGSGPLQEAQRTQPRGGSFPAVGTGGTGVRTAGRGRGKAGTILGPSPPAPMHPGSDGKRPSCLPGKDVSCAGCSQAEPARCPPQALPRSLCFLATLERAPDTPPGSHCTPQPPHPTILSSLVPKQESEYPDLTRLR